MSFIGWVTTVILAIQFVIIVTANLRKRRIPFIADILAFVAIITAIINAIANMTLWPLVTVVLQVGVLIILVMLTNRWEVQEMLRRDREWRAMQDTSNIYLIHESHINRDLKGQKDNG